MFEIKSYPTVEKDVKPSKPTHRQLKFCQCRDMYDKPKKFIGEIVYYCKTIFGEDVWTLIRFYECIECAGIIVDPLYALNHLLEKGYTLQRLQKELSCWFGY